MNDERTHFSLSCTDSDRPAPVLTSVHVEGRLDAVLFELTLRQTYRNTSEQALEVVYTFPLPAMAVLLGFASELNGERQEGVIVARPNAERQYEEALEEGDAPVMLEAHGAGLHTANIGNLKPGDEIVLKCRFTQLLSFEQSRLRVSVPTTIAPRYGHAEQAGLQPQQVPLANLVAEYPLTLTLTIGEALAGASIECPTHRLTTTHDPDGSSCMQLEPHAKLDRDVVVVVTPCDLRPSLFLRADDRFNPSAPVVTMAALQLPSGTTRAHIALKLLVDCSGSMNGDSMASARVALRAAVAGLTEHDCVSLSRFGSTLEHLFAPSPARPQSIRHLQQIIDRIDADLGGTEMEAALGAVFELGDGAGQGGADVLLITDGEIWQTDEIVAAARQSGHRIFAIGVGSAPAEGVLRALAESTGGACEFATPGEALEAAALRMLQRMRQAVFKNVRVVWDSTPMWSVGPARNLFGGDTVIALAGFDVTIDTSAVHLMADDANGKTVQLARAEAGGACPGDSLARIAAARRIALDPDADAVAMAVQYQLMSRQTNCILVHRRAEADKNTEQAELHRVSSMLAAGWGGLGSVRESAHTNVFETRVMSYSSPSALSFGDSFDLPALLRKARVEKKPATLEAMARSVSDHLAHRRQVKGMAASRGAMTLHTDAQQALDDVIQLGLSQDEAWLLLAHWVNGRANGLADAGLTTLLDPFVTAIDTALAMAAAIAFERQLGSYSTDDWTQARDKRLRRAIGRSGN